MSTDAKSPAVWPMRRWRLACGSDSTYVTEPPSLNSWNADCVVWTVPLVHHETACVCLRVGSVWCWNLQGPNGWPELSPFPQWRSGNEESGNRRGQPESGQGPDNVKDLDDKIMGDEIQPTYVRVLEIKSRTIQGHQPWQTEKKGVAIRPPVQVRHKHAMVSVAHVQLAQRAVSQTPSRKETLRKKRLGKIRRGTRKRDRSISSSDGEVKDEKEGTLSVRR